MRKLAAGSLAAAITTVLITTIPLPAVRADEVSRDLDPVVVVVADIPELAGRFVDEVALFRVDPQTMTFVPIPFQVDERYVKIFNEGEGNEFPELIYDVFGEDDGILDAEDEIAFMFRDSGPRTPGGLPWPEGAETLRFEIAAADTRPGMPAEPRWVYVFTGPGLPRSETVYVSWNLSATGDITTDKFSLEFTDRWLLTGFRLLPPCGSGVDLIDRFKGRANTGVTIQSEETWNLTSEYLGGLAGPIRAIRYVKGAASGVNTIHYDTVYLTKWVKRVNLRVHPITWARLYFDWLPIPDAAYYSPDAPSGVSVDGTPDGVVGQNPTWGLFRSSEGGLAVVYDFPPSPLYSGVSRYYVDDVGYDDAIGVDYPDEDDSAFGNHGFTLQGLGNSHLNAIPMILHVYPICAQSGDAGMGNAFDELTRDPVDIQVAAQALGEVDLRSLTVRRQASNTVLTWAPVHPAAGYRVYRSEFADLPPTSWTFLGEVVGSTFVDTDTTSAPRYFYDVRVVEEP